MDKFENESKTKRNQFGRKSITESRAFQKRKEYLKKAYMNALGYGEEVELISNNKNTELLDYLIGAKGTVVNRVDSTKKNNDGSVDYFVMFGELKVNVNSNDLKLIEEEESG